MEKIVFPFEPGGVLRDHSALVRRALSCTPGLLPLWTGRGIFQPLYHRQTISPLGAGLLLPANRSRIFFPLEPAPTRGESGDLEGTVGQTPRRPTLCALVGCGDRFLLPLAIQAA